MYLGKVARKLSATGPLTEPPVNASRKSWTRFSRFTLGFLGLAFCVLTWGLQYKLSLYDPPQAISHSIPEAKLLSKEEWKAGSDDPLVREAGDSDKEVGTTLIALWVPLFFLVVSNLLVLAAKDFVFTEQPWQVCSRAALNAFFFRPPPILV